MIIDNYNINSNIKNKELRAIKTVLDKYNLVIENITKVRSIYKIICSEETVCLKRVKGHKQKILNGNLLSTHLKDIGFCNTLEYLKTVNEDLYVTYKGYTYFVTKWIEGEECDISSIDDTINSIKLLAEFHLACNKLYLKKVKLKNEIIHWPKVFYDSLLDFEKYKKIIDRKKIKNDFDLQYYSSIDNYYQRIMKALYFLKESKYYTLADKAAKNKSLCHNSFYYQNIIKCKEEYYIIDLDSITIDIQIIDLCKYIRRLMYRSNFSWNFDEALKLIVEYDRIKSISLEELEVMIAILIFPHKFWKLGKKRYLKQKNWSESKYKHKLLRISKYYEKEEEFFQKFISYIESRKVEEKLC